MKLSDKLIDEIHKRDMKIVLDLVLNHTSDQHPWFLESRFSLDNPKRDWYIWADGKGKNKPPTNWHSMIGGSGWQYDEKTEQWYWCQFLPFQPDLNYYNPEVKKEMFDMVRFWLRKKVDGFRLDIVDAICKDPSLRNNPLSLTFMPSDTSIKRFFRNSIYNLDHPDTFGFVKELRSVMDEFDNPQRFLVGEIITDESSARRYCGGDNGDGLHSVFLFRTLRTKHTAKKFRQLIDIFEENFNEPHIPTWVFTNHDRMRRITRLGNDIAMAKLHAAFQLTVRGIPYIYYGEEIGMESPRMVVKNSVDEMALKYKWIPQKAFDLVRKIAIESFNREEQRTPMQWNTLPNAGFCPPDVKPWLPVPPSYKDRNVESELKDPASLLNCYKRFLKARKDNPALNSGNIEILNLRNVSKDLLGYKRRSSKQLVYVYLNFGDKNYKLKSPIVDGRVLVSTSLNKKQVLNNIIALESQEGIVII
jgi:oligo-1,6-glucosidase/alpha-glucosidase